MARKRSTRFAFLALPIFLLTACQPTPAGPAVVGRGGEELEQKLTAAPLAPYVYEAPAAVDDIIQMNVCQFVVDTPVEVSDAEAHPVLLMRQREFTKADAEKVVKALAGEVVSMRDGSQLTKEQVEQYIFQLKRGIPQYHEDGSITYEPNEAFQKIESDLYEMLENAPSEAFEPIQGLPDCTPTMQKVFRRADETEAGCYIYPDNMVLFPHGEGLLQFQSWLIREGGWEGEGPVLLSPTLSQEAAKRVGDDLMADLELPHMRLATVEAGRMIESYGYNTIAVGWILTYTRGEGNEVPFDANMVSSKAMIFDDEASYAPPWNQEAI